MPELTDIQRDLLALEAELKRLEAEYNMFFAGRLPRPPWETRGRVEATGQAMGPRLHSETQRSVPVRDAAVALPDVRSICGIAACAREEEGRPGPFAQPAAETAKPRAAEDRRDDSKVVHVTAFKDPMREMDKLHELYDSLMDARREAGDDVVPFHKFAALVKTR